jgi:hypothetical protein
MSHAQFCRDLTLVHIDKKLFKEEILKKVWLMGQCCS